MAPTFTSGERAAQRGDVRRPARGTVRAVEPSPPLVYGSGDVTMTIDQLIAAHGRQLSHQLGARAPHAETIARVRTRCQKANRDPNPGEADEVRTAQEALDLLDDDIRRLRREMAEFEEA